MLAEIFMVRLEAERRRVEEVLPSSTSNDAKGGESSDKDGPVTEVR
jgi:hypothetical protein